MDVNGFTLIERIFFICPNTSHNNNMTDTPNKVNEDEKESKQPLPSDAISVILTTDHQQSLDKAANSVQEGAIKFQV